MEGHSGHSRVLHLKAALSSQGAPKQAPDQAQTPAMLEQRSKADSTNHHSVTPPTPVSAVLPNIYRDTDSQMGLLLADAQGFGRAGTSRPCSHDMKCSSLKARVCRSSHTGLEPPHGLYCTIAGTQPSFREEAVML